MTRSQIDWFFVHGHFFRGLGKGVLIILLGLFNGCRAANSDSNSESEPLLVSLVQLIADPGRFDGKVVRCIGFCRIQFEGDAIYLHEDDFKHFITRNGLWLDIPKDHKLNRTALDQRYVLVEAQFSSIEHGHMDLFSGSLQKIRRIEPVPIRSGEAPRLEK